MVFDLASASHLKPWLVRTLEPICDAEPGALADYILALLKHNVPEAEMRQELANQLDEFLEKECAPFIDTLFTVLRTKSYLPYTPASDTPSQPEMPPEEGIPIPMDGLLTPSSSSEQQPRIRKRSNTGDERDGRPPAKGPRLNNDAQFSRYGNGGGDGSMGQSSGNWGRPQHFNGNGMGMGMGMNPYAVPMNGIGMNGMGMNGMNGMGQMNNRRPQGYQPPDQKRGICRDYHNNGYCARGAMCKFSHGDDAVVPGQMFPGAPGMPFMPMFPGNGMPFIQNMQSMQNGGYDPQEARMDMRPMPPRQHQRAPLLPRIQQEDGSRVVHPMNASGELPVIQDLTPHIPDIPVPTEPLPSGDVDMQVPSNGHVPQNVEGRLNNQTRNGPNQYQAMNGHMEVDNDSAHTPGSRPPTLGRGGFRGRGGSKGRGMFGGEVHNFRPEKRGDKTLVVEKIPEDKLSLDQVNEWFKRFGTVTNVAIDAMGGKALVSFSKHEEAHAAWKSEDAVFGNRFVKVFWHRPMEGHGQVGVRMLAASAPLVANIGGKPTTPAPAPNAATPSASTGAAIPPSSSTTSVARKASAVSTSSSTISALAAKQQLLEKMIAEQKTLMASLGTATAEEKKDTMARLRKLGEEMSKLTSSSATGSGSSSTTSKPVDKATELEKKERARLDKELELHSGADEASGESAEDLKAQLERLKAEAASLGLDGALPSSSAPYRGGYRGRARGARGYFRGSVMRGGPPRASMKLDNRPKKLLVKGVGEDSSQALRDWYETTGYLDNIEPAEVPGSYIVSFKSRSAAEQGLAKGSNIPIVGSVLITWYTGHNSGTNGTTIVQPKSSSSNAPKGGEHLASSSEVAPSPETHLSHLQEEEIVASGWGNDGDDEDGMGLL